MSPSEKRLALGLSGVVAIAGLLWMRTQFMQPVATAEKALDLAKVALDGEELNVIAALAKVRTMELHKDRSLSSNVSEASLGYEQWLSDLAENVAKFRDPEVSRETTSPSRDNSYVSIKIRVAGRGTMKQLREFLYRFHRANVLHQISSLTIDAVDNSSNPLLDIVLMADGLSLRSAPAKGPTLFARSEVISVKDGPDGTLRQLTVADATAAWPAETPFEIRVDDKFLTVLERAHQVWEIQGKGANAKAGATVTLVEKKAKEGDTKTESASQTGADTKVAESDSKKVAPPTKKAVTTKLVTAWDGESGAIVVQIAEGFAPGRLQIQIGDDTLDVVARREVWQIDDQRFRASEGTVVEASPIRDEFKDVSIEKFAALVDLNPFARKRTIPPDFILPRDPVKRGETVVMTPRVNLGPNAAPPKIEVVSELPPGMTFADGNLTWVTTEEMEPAKFDIVLRATSDDLPSPLEEKFDVSIYVPTVENKPPVASAPEGAVVAILGQPLKFQVTAVDLETPAEELRFTAGANFPEGASVDATTGEVSWTVPEDGQPGPVEFPITVVDAGTPPQSGAVTVSVDVQEDRAIFTYLTASIAADDQRQAWLYDRSSNKRVILEEGDEFEFAGFEALVLSIDRDFVTMKQERNTLRLDIGNSLREAVVIATAPDPKETEAELDALLKGLDEAEAKPGETQPGEEPTTSDKGDVPATTAKPEVKTPAEPKATEPKPATGDDTPPRPATEEDLDALLKALEEAEAAKPGDAKPAEDANDRAKPNAPPEPEVKKPQAPVNE
jgi:hypothetical protein